MIENKTSRKCAIYCRVSTSEQDPDKQADLLKTFSFNKTSRFTKSILMLYLV